MKFTAWMKKVDEICEEYTGLCTSDFEDWLWMDAFRDGMEPDEAFHEFVDDVGLRRDYPDVFADV